MKKKLTKVFSLVMAAALTGTLLSGCGGTEADNDAPFDNTKAHLYIGNLLSGFRDDWLKAQIADFEEYYKDTDFDGKKGIQVHIDNKNSEFLQSAIYENMKYYENDLYYLDNIPDLERFVTGNVIAETTEWVTEKIYDEDGNIAKDTGKPATQSIIDTMYEGWAQDYEFDGKYYGLSWRVAYGGIIYDADLFDSEGLYYYADGELGATQEDIDAGDCSIGPDGKPGTIDDGMPVTWADFLRLVNEMVAKNITPFTWAGQTSYQRSNAFNYIYANYEGANDYALNFSLNGTDGTLGEITEATGYKLLEQEGRNAALKAFYDISRDTRNYSENAFKSTQSHKQAEYEYVFSTRTNKKIAMLMEGGWWEVEAKEYFNTMGKTNPNLGYGKRNFRLLPVPDFVGVDGVETQTNNERVLYGTGSNSLECVSANSPRKELAKLWLQFVHSREQLSSFTEETSAFRPFNFVATEEEFARYTSYTKSIYTMIDEGAKTVTDHSNSKFYKANNSYFDTFKNQVKIGNTTYTEPMAAFVTDKNFTVSHAFKSMAGLKDSYPRM